MNNLKKRLWGFLLFISIALLLCNYKSVVDFISHRSYETASEEELTGMFLVAEFSKGTEVVLEEDEFTELIQNFPFFKNGKVHKGVLTDGRTVLVVSKSFMGDFTTNESIRGIFTRFPEGTYDFAGEYDVEPYVFFCFENYLSRNGEEYLRPNLVMFFAGLLGVFLCICMVFSKWFPNLFPALLKREKTLGRAVRDSNFELLRILCMIMIIMQHYGFWGEFDISGDITTNTIILQGIVNVGKIGVNCFMMITGYYCAFSTFKPSKITSLVARVWFYTWGIGIILFSAGVGIRSVGNLINTVFPICSGAFWFITVYLIVYVFSPYINMMIQNVTKEQYKTLLVFLFIIWSVIPSVIKPGWGFTNIGWMIFMYLLGGYMRKFPEVFADCKLKALLSFVGSYAVLMYLTILWDEKVEKVVYHQMLAQKHTLPIVICSVALFVLFKNLNIGKNKVINKIAASTFGVYLIHENPVLKGLLWTKWLHVSEHFVMDNFVLNAVGTILLVYVLCTVIDMILNEIINIFYKITGKCRVYAHVKEF